MMHSHPFFWIRSLSSNATFSISPFRHSYQIQKQNPRELDVYYIWPLIGNQSSMQMVIKVHKGQPDLNVLNLNIQYFHDDV